MNKDFDSVLKIDKKPPSQRQVFDKRMNRINEAISWSGGTFSNKHYHGIWENETYRIALGKPGKETTRESGYTNALNVNDMRPDIFKNGVKLEVAATFGDIVYDLEQVAKAEKYCVELLGVLFFRSAFLLDHAPEKFGENSVIYRYKPNAAVVNYITEKIPLIYDVPPEVFIHYLDAIALNEDVKYHTKGVDLSSKATGGRNNYLTYVMIIAVICGDLPVSEIAKKLLRTNVSAIGVNKAMEILPHLSIAELNKH